MDFFTKPLAHMSADDIHWLIKNQLQESSSLEFKALPTAQEDNTKPWIKPDGTITDEGKRKLLKEVVAFANANGGTLIFGIGEKNAYASALTPIPHVEVCARRLTDICRSIIEPAIPGLEIKAIPMALSDLCVGFNRAPPPGCFARI